MGRGEGGVLFTDCGEIGEVMVGKILFMELGRIILSNRNHTCAKGEPYPPPTWGPIML